MIYPPDTPLLPERPQDGLPEPFSPLLRRIGASTLALTWHMARPRQRGPFTVGQEPVVLPRVYYTADDGWQAPLFYVAPAPGSAGEPVILAHGLGGTWRDYSLEPTACLAATLADAGYAVYLLTHRGDRDALPPEAARPFSVDDIALRDVPAAIDAVRAHSGYGQVLWIGHGLGAQIFYLSLALLGGSSIAAAALLCGAARFASPRTTVRAAGQLASLLPKRWMLPGRRFQQLAAALVGDGAEVGSPDTTGAALRGRLRYASGDLHLGVLRQMARWLARGHLTDVSGRLDVTEALAGLPDRPATLVIEGDADPTCPVGASLSAATALGADYYVLTGFGHLDPLLGARAPTEVHPHLLVFLNKHRKRCWED